MKLIATILFPFLILTCGIVEFLFPINYPQRYIERDVNLNELIGTWTITAESESRIMSYLQQQDGFWPITPAPWKSITLNDDSSCKADIKTLWAINNEVLSNEDAPPTCTWEIGRVLAYDEQGASKYATGLILTFEHYNLQEAKYYIYHSKSYIIEENNKLVLWSFIGNPSNMRYQDFEKAIQ